MIPANVTDAAGFSGKLTVWQQHNAGALFRHPHGELLVAPLNPNPNLTLVPAITSSPLMFHSHIFSSHHPSFLPLIPAILRIPFVIPPLIL